MSVYFGQSPFVYEWSLRNLFFILFIFTGFVAIRMVKISFNIDYRLQRVSIVRPLLIDLNKTPKKWWSIHWEGTNFPTNKVQCREQKRKMRKDAMMTFISIFIAFRKLTIRLLFCYSQRTLVDACVNLCLLCGLKIKCLYISLYG